MAAFDQFVRGTVPATRLQACGIAPDRPLDYGAFLKSKGISTVDAFTRILGDPAFLGPDYLTFMYRHAADFVAQARRHAERRAGHPLMLSVNSSPRIPRA